jgi:hypothetical protein
MQKTQFKSGDLVVVPQLVDMVRIDNNNGITAIKAAQKPLFGVYLNSRDHLSEIVVDSETWLVRTDSLNKGEKNVDKNDRSL